MKHFTNNSAFLIQEPEPGDTRERNAFGMLKDFDIAYGIFYAQRDDGTLFPMPKRQPRPLSAMRDAVIRHLEKLASNFDLAAEDSRDGNWSLHYWLDESERRLERLLARIENKLAPHLAARRDAIEHIAEQRRQEARAERERIAHVAQVEREREQSCIDAAIDADPRVVAALDAHQLAWAKEQTTDAVEKRIDAWLNDPSVPWDEKVPVRLTAARCANTRACIALGKASSALSATRDRVRQEFRRIQNERKT